MAGVELRKVNKIYEPAGSSSQPGFAIQDLDLKAEDGEFLVLLGPSGCGKSTTLRMIAGLEHPDSGDIFIDGVRVNDVAPKDRDIAMVFQNYALYPHMTVYENMAFGLKQRHMSKADIDKKVRETAETLGLTEYLGSKPGKLSGGQRQRVAIGRAIVRDPKVFLMDEPLSNLDYKLRNQLRTELIKLRQKIDATFVYVTHDQTEAVTLGDRIVIMRDGRVQQVGTPYQVFNEPANLFVASFIGNPQMNFFDAELSFGDDGLWAELGGVRIWLGQEKSRRIAESGAVPGTVILGIRAEDLDICDASDSAALCGHVEMFEMMGSSVYLHLGCLDREIVVISRKKDSRGQLITDYRQGQEVYFRPDPSAVHLFDKNTHENLEQGREKL